MPLTARAAARQTLLEVSVVAGAVACPNRVHGVIAAAVGNVVDGSLGGAVPGKGRCQPGSRRQ